MVSFTLFYLLLISATYIYGVFNANAIAPLVISYGSILYYFFKYMQADNAIGYRPAMLNIILIALVAFEFDNIIAYQESLRRLLPTSVDILICLCLIAFLLAFIGSFKFIPFFTKYNLQIACTAILIINVLFIFFVKPGIDVYVHLKEAVEYFLALKNPYTNIYTQIYSPQQIKLLYYNDPVFLKYVPFQSVPPLSIAISAIGYLAGDVRITNAILFCFTPILLKKICSKILPALPDNDHNKMALVLLLFPAQLHLIFNAWTDMQLGFFIILFIYFFLNKQKVASYIALGIFLSLKQYSVIYLIPFLFIMNLKDWKFYLVTGGIILLPLLFYALWDFNGFMDSIILYELKQPFRKDSISISALLFRFLGVNVYAGLANTIILFSSVAISVHFSLRKLSLLETEYQQIKYMLYVILFQFANFLMFSKQSFLNQYYFLILIFYLAMLFSMQAQESN